MGLLEMTQGSGSGLDPRPLLCRQLLRCTALPAARASARPHAGHNRFALARAL